MRFASALAGALLAMAGAPALAQWTVGDLMKELAARGSAEARFTERRYVPVLDAPVQSSGTLKFVAPDRIEKHTHAPRTESLVLAGEQLTLRQGERTRVLALADLPDGGVAIASLRGTMAGNLALLQRGWDVTLHGDRRLWTLSLAPASATVAKYIDSVWIQGRQGTIDRIEIRQTDGVRSVMEIVQDGSPGPVAPR